MAIRGSNGARRRRALVAVTTGANAPQSIGGACPRARPIGQDPKDANGNLTGDGVWTFAYDAENRLRTASKAGASASYAYDVMSRRQANAESSTPP
jgi:hypothetical protein